MTWLRAGAKFELLHRRGGGDSFLGTLEWPEVVVMQPGWRKIQSYVRVCIPRTSGVLQELLWLSSGPLHLSPWFHHFDSQQLWMVLTRPRRTADQEQMWVICLFRDNEVFCCLLHMVSNCRVMWNNVHSLHAVFTWFPPRSHLSCLCSYCTLKVMHYFYHNVSKSMCLAATEGTIGNKSCVSFWRPLSTFCTKSLCEILGKITVELCVLP